ncbi:MAG TPA: ATP-binding protein [Candidatus Polarisedimenticolia bacterium]|nr:ATP-binding protein [Candidatus Polarisedimenticolia bacterium]
MPALLPERVQRVISFCRGLRGKFILLISVLLVISSMVLGWILLVQEVHEEAEKLQSKSKILGRNLAANGELGVYTRNREMLAARAREILAESDVAFVAIFDGRGELLFSDSRKGVRMPPLSRLTWQESAAGTPSGPAEGEVSIYRDSTGRQEIYLFRVPVLTQRSGTVGEEIGFLPDSQPASPTRWERIGSVAVGISTQIMRGDILRLEKAMGVATLVVIAVGILLTVLLVRVVVDPVNQLVYATRRIANGDLDILLHLSSQDEIGELARSFNQMTLKLRKSREELERTNLNLEQKVRERTQKLEETQNQLVQAEKMSVVGQLVSGVAHELNNPLAGVLGYSQLLLRMPVGEEVRRGLEKIETEADRCKRIVQNLLMFARKHKPQKRLIDLNSVVESVLELKEYQLKVDNVKIVKDLQPNLPKTMADAGQLQQVLMNIINNAEQAMKEAKGTTLLSLRSFAEPGKVHLEIRDTGPGISPENLGKIFDPFFTTKEVGQGTGLGLSICYGIVEEHKGRIWAESRLGEGTSFHLEIPVQADEEGVWTGLPQDHRQQVQVSEGDRASARILVVDDEASIVDILYDVLRLDGHRIETALNGRLALKKLQQEHFDVVISDLKMPGMSGQELYESMKRMKSDLLGRIIFTTGDVASQETEGFLRRSGNPYLQKPFDLNEVRRLVHEILATGAGTRSELPFLTLVEPPDPDPAS